MRANAEGALETDFSAPQHPMPAKVSALSAIHLHHNDRSLSVVWQISILFALEQMQLPLRWTETLQFAQVNQVLQLRNISAREWYFSLLSNSIISLKERKQTKENLAFGFKYSVTMKIRVCESFVTVQLKLLLMMLIFACVHHQ